MAPALFLVCIYYTLLVAIIICIMSVNLENVGEFCKAQRVCVHQKIALYKSYLLLLGRTKTLICFTLSSVVFMSNAWKNFWHENEL